MSAHARWWNIQVLRQLACARSLFNAYSHQAEAMAVPEYPEYLGKLPGLVVVEIRIMHFLSFRGFAVGCLPFQPSVESLVDVFLGRVVPFIASGAY